MVSPLEEKIFISAEYFVHKLNSSKKAHPLFDGFRFQYTSFDDGDFDSISLIEVDEYEISRPLTPDKKLRKHPSGILFLPDPLDGKSEQSLFYDLTWIIKQS